MNLTKREEGILAICRLNQAMKRIEIVKKWRVGRLEVEFNWRSAKNLWGRFGGGWNWKVGFQASGSTVIVFLLICYFVINWRKNNGT